MFKLHSEYKPTGDQPQAIEYLSKGIKEGKTEAKIEIFKGMMKKLDKSAEEVLDMVEMDDEEKKKLLDKLK